MTGRRKDAAPAATLGGLWIRVAADLADRKVTWRLVEVIRVHHPAGRASLGAPLPIGMLRAAAVGYLVELWGNIAKHTPDGVVAGLPPTMLEHWAGWDGDAGEFYRWLAAEHLDPDTGKPREWDDYQGAIQTKRQADAARQRDKRARDAGLAAALRGRDVPPATPAPAPAPAGEPVPADDASRFALLLTRAANKGMSDNAQMGGEWMPITAGRGDSLAVVDTFRTAGVTDDDTMARIVYTLAKHYAPRRPGDYIRSLTFFIDRALLAYRNAAEKVAAGKAPAIAELSIDRTPMTAGARSSRSAAGAMAAGAAAGLADEDDEPATATEAAD